QGPPLGNDERCSSGSQEFKAARSKGTVNNWDEANEILAGGGRSAKFPEIGTSYAGEVLDVRVADQTNFDTGAVETWPDGRPKKMLIVSLQTKLQEDDDDDGVRTIYAKGGIYTAIRDA